jgi:hypothetical protein
MTKVTYDLKLDGTKHIYNEDMRTLHVTLEHLFGANHGISIDSDGCWDGSDVLVTNPKTGVSVRFAKLSTWSNNANIRAGNNVSYSAIWDRRLIVLTVWKDTETLKTYYSAKTPTYNGN